MTHLTTEQIDAINARARAGYAVMENVLGKDRWQGAIDLDTFDMDKTGKCVVGQCDDANLFPWGDEDGHHVSGYQECVSYLAFKDLGFYPDPVWHCGTAGSVKDLWEDAHGFCLWEDFDPTVKATGERPLSPPPIEYEAMAQLTAAWFELLVEWREAQPDYGLEPLGESYG